MEKNLELEIIRQIKRDFNERDLDVSLTPIIYKQNDFRPTIGVRVKEDGKWVVKYTINLIENK